MPREISESRISVDEVCADTIMTSPKKNRESELNLLPKQRKRNVRVESVQYSPSGIFSDRICACNPLNRTAKVIRYSIAITANPGVSCVAPETEKKYRTFLERLLRCAAGLEISSTQSKPMLSFVWLFRFSVCSGCVVDGRLCFCFYFRLHFSFYYCVFLCWLLLLLLRSQLCPAPLPANDSFSLSIISDECRCDGGRVAKRILYGTSQHTRTYASLTFS